MLLADEIKKIINQEYSKSGIRLKLSQVIIYRPVFHELPFENLEIINDAKRCMACNPIHIGLVDEPSTDSR